jgi:folylpolyglutamate synthase/dihydropteroate synthase
VVSVFSVAQPRAAVSVAPSVAEALALTRRDELVVITGSLYLIGEVMELLGLGHAAHERALNEWTVGSARR